MNNGKLNDNIIKEICEKIIKGADKKTAAETSGISERTFYRWVKQGETAKTGKYCQFCQAIKKAEAELKQKHEQKILSAKSWTSSAWWLERKFPDEYRNRQQIEHTQTEPFKIEFTIVEKKEDDKADSDKDT